LLENFAEFLKIYNDHKSHLGWAVSVDDGDDNDDDDDDDESTCAVFLVA